MAESMNSDPSRSNEGEDETRVRRKSGKSQPPKQESTDRPDNVFGFFRLKFLSLFGWRRGSLEDVESKEAKEDRRSSSPPKAKSTENIFSDAGKGTAKPPRPKAPVVGGGGGNPSSRGPSIKSTQSMGKQLSVSADNLISPANQLSAAASQGAISDRSVSKASTLDTSNDELDSSTELVDDFFVDKWTNIRIDNRARSLSSSDVNEADMDFDLDAIRGTKALDVSVCKDRILIKPKGKKLTQAMQEKVKTAEMDVKPANRVQLHSVAEVDEEELSNDPRRKEKKQDDGTSSCPQSPNEEATNPLPEAPPRRKKSQGLLAVAAADKSCYRKTIGIEITPSMLTGALRKTTAPDREGGSFSRTRPADGNAVVPPLDGSWKRRQEKAATVAPNGCESQGAATSNGSPATTGDNAMVVTGGGGGGGAAGGGGGGSSVLKRHVPSCSEDEAENKGARPKEPPPKTRPKTRPKTMLNPIASSSSPSTTQQQLSQ